MTRPMTHSEQKEDRAAVKQQPCNIAQVVQVTGNVYIRAVMSAASVLYATSRIVSDYDKVAGTDYADNILFSLK